MNSDFLSSDWNNSEYEGKGGKMSDWGAGRKVQGWLQGMKTGK